MEKSVPKLAAYQKIIQKKSVEGKIERVHEN